MEPAKCFLGHADFQPPLYLMEPDFVTNIRLLGCMSNVQENLLWASDIVSKERMVNDGNPIDPQRVHIFDEATPHATFVDMGKFARQEDTEDPHTTTPEHSSLVPFDGKEDRPTGQTKC